MYITTITWKGAEIGYGQGESANFSKSEALASVDSIYRAARSEWVISTRKEG